MRLHSITARILGGFGAILALQVGMAVTIWQAERRVEKARIEDVREEARAHKLSSVSSALQAAQLRLADYLRTGNAAQHVEVDKVLDALTVQVKDISSENGSGSLTATITDVKGGLQSVMSAAIKRRAASTALTAAILTGQNAIAALGQAVPRSPDRLTLEAAVALFAGAPESLTFAARYALAVNPTDEKSASAALANFKAGLVALLQSGADVPARVARIATTLSKVLDGLDPAMASLEGAEAQSNAALVSLDALVRKADAILVATTAQIADERAVSQADAQSARQTMDVTIVVAAVIGCLLGLILATLVGLSITRPIGRLAATMRRIADGFLEAEVPDQRRRDEVGAMAVTVQAFRDAAIAKGRLEHQSEADRRAAEAERAKADAERRVVAEQQAAVVDGLAHALVQLSTGDLTCSLDEAFAPDYEKLRHDFNQAVNKLGDVVRTIVDNTDALHSGTGEISKAADDLSRRTEQQAASLEQTAAALDEITATVKKTAGGANAARNVAASAKTEAERGEKVVRDAVDAMNAIEGSSGEIGQIIGVIDEIAFQTNLLALNAGVEAARAGDAGRGFAVVASEVRALAQRSAQAAKEIKTLIRTSGSNVARGVSLVQQTGTALSQILSYVTEINGAVTDIAASAHEQATGLAQVNTAINQMDQVTQQNAAMVEQATAASHSLAADTANLQKLAVRFKVGPSQKSSSAESGSVGQAERIDLTPPRSVSPRSARSLKIVGSRTATQSKPEGDEWEEF